ncbi:MAG: methyltransferase domain-containing protein [Patescibacteria group bacterium]
MSNQIGFEYSNEGGETAFETFLRYSNEKDKSSEVLGRILNRLLVEEGMTVLDIGSGNGEYLRLSLIKAKIPRKTMLTLLEPSKDLAERLIVATKQFPDGSIAKVIHSTPEDFVTEDRFDVILISHVPLAKNQADKLPAIYRKILGLLKPRGSLIIVLRGKDDIHEFRTVFKSQLMGINYRSMTIDDAVETLSFLAKSVPLNISMHTAKAELHVPYCDNIRDAISIVEFFLNKRWDEIPNNIREAIMSYIRQKNGVLKHIDCFAVARKTNPFMSAP